jgi:hypothetical protein
MTSEEARRREETQPITDLFICLYEYRYSPYVRPPVLVLLV